jgi:CDGSH-type Zn-finger protein
MPLPSIAKKGPYLVKVEAGKTYYWCSCGLSQNQPFCDGSHKPTDFVPLAYVASESAEIAMCGCKRTSKEPLCDGSHLKL